MNRQEVFNWIDLFISAWKEYDFIAIGDLFSDVEEYWESPFADPVSGKDNIKKLWDDIVFQKEIDLNISIIAIENNNASLHWYLKYKDSRDNAIYEMDGTYFLVFNDNKKCVYFKQWWVMNE